MVPGAVMMNSKSVLQLCLLLAIQGYGYSQENTWSYSGDNGPEFWQTTAGAELCDSSRDDSIQSPIDIVVDDTKPKQFEPWVPKGFFDEASADGPRPASVTNTGLGVVINVAGEYTFRGAGLPSTYTVENLRLHWGADSSKGSEHTVDGKQYAGELHLVYYDSLNYSDFESASSNPQGVATSAWFIEEGEYNAYWEPVINAAAAEQIKYAGNTFAFVDYFMLGFLVGFQDFSNFYRYIGSLTYPNCHEGVIWSVFKQTVELSSEQLDALRSLSALPENSPEVPLVDNFRPVQPLNDRNVYDAYIPTEDNKSCVERCNNQLDKSFPCQCNAACVEYDNCCEDYRDQCLIELCTYVHSYDGKMRKQRPLM